MKLPSRPRSFVIPAMHPEEQELINSFFAPNRRERYRILLRDPDRRGEALNRLNHLAVRDLDPRYATELSKKADVLALLKSKGAPDECYIVSDIPEIDGCTMRLGDALRAADRGVWGTIISCITGKLAYYQDEWAESRVLLERQ